MSKIGVFDSGMGGLTFLKPAHLLLPHEDFIYYGDTANAPYGTKAPGDVLKWIDTGVQFLLSMGVQALVLACNTASSVAVESLRQTYSIPIIAMEPAIKAAQAIAKGKIVVLATELTIKLPKFRNLMERYPQNLSAVPVYGLVELIERGITEGKEVTDCLHRALEGVTEGSGIDTLVLGCTHYPFVRDSIRGIVGPETKIIDGTLGTIRHLREVLTENHLLCEDTAGSVSLHASDSTHGTLHRMEQLLRHYTPEI